MLEMHLSINGIKNLFGWFVTEAGSPSHSQIVLIAPGEKIRNISSFYILKL